MKNLQIFIGIDQTGAVDSKGRPKPLNVSLIDLRKKRPAYFTNLKISSLDKKNIEALLREHIAEFSTQHVLICVDTVFGLPQELKTPFMRILKDAKDYTFQGKSFGSQVAHSFFVKYLISKQVPIRKVEGLVKANSVFNLHPFQKNIGCGSFRIIKDLAQDPGWFSLWPFHKLTKQYIICEGYPSYFWKNLLNSKIRDLKFLKEKFKTLDFKNLDQADSFVLAYGASKNVEQLLNFRLPTKFNKEGWILGVPLELRD